MTWIEEKRTEAVFLKLLWSPGIDSKEFILPAYALAGLYNNPIPARLLALLKRSQIQAQDTLDSGIGSLESIPGLLKRLQIRAQATLDSRIVSLELIPGLLKRLKIWAQSTLDSRIGSLKSIPRLHKRLQIRAQDYIG
jgi:hypothetical protein